MSRTDTLLVEIGTEELPPACQHELAESLAEKLGEALGDAGLAFAGKKFFSTPRRLAVLFYKLEASQKERNKRVTGPPLENAFDESGNAKAAAIGFAKKFNVHPDALIRDEKTGRLACDVHVPGLTVDVLFPEVLKRAVQHLHLHTKMRWGAHPFEFVRPVRWLCVLHGAREIKMELFGIQSSRCTCGHIHHMPDALSLREAGDYQRVLRERGKVEVDPSVRREKILDDARNAANKAGGHLRESERLLDEVVAMVEWPLVVAGSFDKRFLSLPHEVILETLEKTLKAFGVSSSKGELMPGFIIAANVASKDPSRIRIGYEKVAHPRLEDALFFYEQDGKKSLTDRQEGLNGISFLSGQGSLAEKTQRVSELAHQLAPLCGADPGMIKDAALLCKTDLLTDMVREYPTLQGTIGKYYALRDGLPATVAIAIEEHLLPRQSGDTLAETPAGICLALADRLDSLVGIFSTGYKAVGSSDPLGARRVALGILRILVEKGIHLSIHDWLERARQISCQPDSPKLSGTTGIFLYERFKTWCTERGSSRAHVSAVWLSSAYDFYDASLRLSALEQFMQSSQAVKLAEVSKRIRNILRKAPQTCVNPNRFQQEAERALYEHSKDCGLKVKALCAERKYFDAMQELALLSEPLDRFFVDVMVLCEDRELRDNRLGLLGSLELLFLEIADFSQVASVAREKEGSRTARS